MTRSWRSQEPSRAAPGQATLTKQELLEQARFAVVGAALGILFLLFLHYPYAPQGSFGHLQDGYPALVAVLSAFMLSFRARPREKLIGILASSSVLGLVNLARTSALDFARANLSPAFTGASEDASAILLVVLGLGLFVLWTQWVSEAGRENVARWLICLVLILGGVFAWPVLRTHFTGSYCATVNAWSAPLAFGKSGHAALVPQAGPQADVVLQLTVDGINGRWKLERSLRRQAYLPLVLVGSIVLSAPTPHRRKVLLLGVGLGATFAFGLCGFWLLSVYTFSHTIPGVLELSPFSARLVDLSARTFVQPDIVWKAGPILLGLLLVFADRAQQKWQEVQAKASAGGAQEPAKAKKPRRQARRK